MKKIEKYPRKSLSDLISHQFIDNNQEHLEYRLPSIHKNKNQTQKNNNPRTHSVEQQIKSEKKQPQHSRWKMNAQYVDSVRTQQMRIQTEAAKNEDSIPTTIQKIFYTGLSNSGVEQSCNLSQQQRRLATEQAIQKTQEFIKMIKKHRSKLIKLKIKNSNNTLSSQHIDHSDKNLKKKETFGYFSRHLSIGANDIDNDLVERYISTSPSQKIRAIEEKGRRFLLQKIEHDYRNYPEVDNYKKQQVKSMILSQIQNKKVQFNKDFHSRLNIPYFSFLSLKREQQNNIVNRNVRKSFI